MCSKPVILVFSNYFIPGYKAGGPIKSIYNLVNQLADFFTFKIVTLDRDLGDIEPYRDTPLNTWIKKEYADIIYLPSECWTYRNIKHLIEDSSADLIYLNSFFSYLSSIKILIYAKLLGKSSLPVLLAPRGEFSESALKLKWNKKRIFIALARLSRLYSSCFWHFTNESERLAVEQYFPISPGDAFVAGNLPNAVVKDSKEKNTSASSSNILKVVSVGRVSRMKNIDFAIDVLSNVSARVIYDIIGPLEDIEYFRLCEKKAKNLPNHITVRFLGGMPSSEISDRLDDYDLFFSPTRGENYGHAIFEALSAGLPVLLSDRTPWTDLESLGIGWDIALDRPTEFSNAINAFANMSSTKRAVAREKSFQFAFSISKSKETVDKYRSLFIDIINN